MSAKEEKDEHVDTPPIGDHSLSSQPVKSSPEVGPNPSVTKFKNSFVQSNGKDSKFVQTEQTQTDGHTSTSTALKNPADYKHPKYTAPRLEDPLQHPTAKGIKATAKGAPKKTGPTRRIEGKPLKLYRWAMTSGNGGKLDKMLGNMAQKAKKTVSDERTPYAKKLRKRPHPLKTAVQKVCYIYFRYFPPFLLARWMLGGSLVGCKTTLAFLKDVQCFLHRAKKTRTSANQKANSERDTKNPHDKDAGDGPTRGLKPPQTATSLAASATKQNEQNDVLKDVGSVNASNGELNQVETVPASASSPATSAASPASPAAATAAEDSNDSWESAMSSPAKSPHVASSRKARKSQVEVKYSDMVDGELLKMTSSSMWLLLGFLINVYTVMVVSLSSVCSTIHRWAGVPQFATSQDCIDKTDLLVKLVSSLEDQTMNEKKSDDTEPDWLLDRVLEQGVKDMRTLPGMQWVFGFLGIRAGQQIRITGKLLGILKGVVSIASKKEGGNPKTTLVEYLKDDSFYVEEEDPDYVPSAGSSSEDSLEYIDDSDMTLTDEEGKEEDKEDDTVKEETTEEEEEEQKEGELQSVRVAHGKHGGDQSDLTDEKRQEADKNPMRSMSDTCNDESVPTTSRNGDRLKIERKKPGDNGRSDHNASPDESEGSTQKDSVSKNHLFEPGQDLNGCQESINGRNQGSLTSASNGEDPTNDDKDHHLQEPGLYFLSSTSCSPYDTTSSVTTAHRTLTGERKPANSNSSVMRDEKPSPQNHQDCPLPPISTIFTSTKSASENCKAAKKNGYNNDTSIGRDESKDSFSDEAEKEVDEDSPSDIDVPQLSRNDVLAVKRSSLREKLAEHAKKMLKTEETKKKVVEDSQSDIYRDAMRQLKNDILAAKKSSTREKLAAHSNESPETEETERNGYSDEAEKEDEDSASDIDLDVLRQLRIDALAMKKSSILKKLSTHCVESPKTEATEMNGDKNDTSGESNDPNDSLSGETEKGDEEIDVSANKYITEKSEGDPNVGPDSRQGNSSKGDVAMVSLEVTEHDNKAKEASSRDSSNIDAKE